MKEIKKLSLSNVISKLTRNEMRYVMAGSGASEAPGCSGGCNAGENAGQCLFWFGEHLTTGCNCFYNNKKYQSCK